MARSVDKILPGFLLMAGLCGVAPIGPALADPAPAPNPVNPQTGDRPTASAADVRSRQSRLQGRTFIDRNNRVVGAGVIARSQENPSRIFLTTSDATGQFRIPGMPDGSYEVLVTRDGFEPERKEGVELKFPYRAVVELQLRPAGDGAVTAISGGGAMISGRVAVNGQVLDTQGSPVTEAEIRIVHPTGGRDPVQVSTDGKGRFIVEALDADLWRLESRSIGYLPIRQTLALSQDSDIQITLARQPADYRSSPLELMPEEQLVAPDSLAAPGIR